MAEQLTLGIIIVAALADSINPCVFGVLIFLLAYMVTVFKNKLKMLLAGIIYTAVVYITYLLIGIGLLAVAQSTGIVKPFYWVAGIIAILAGILEVKDFFWYGHGFSLQMIPGGAEKIKKLSNAMKKMETTHPLLSLGIAAILGFVVVLFEFPCTGAPYLAIIALLSGGNYASGIPLLLLYNLIFILPLFVLIMLVYFGYASHKLEKWRKEHRGLMRLGVGLFLLAFGAYLINLALHL
ncbi:MAG: GAP family protein [Flavobacteriales bacterium]|jgi:cytochrome c biogenesis protein CcdA|nr:GAP family protein [Flavobacteriales bacterium]|tara:strand:+ start:127 stop:840 length:714 start_codon:yes stop_codon:yes gene_type:complete